jgi:uncharacterized protein (TIGR03435 family)
MLRIIPVTVLSVTVLMISAAAAQPVFDVASVRASQSGRGEGDWRDDIQASPGSVIMRNVSLKTAIRWAYHVMSYQVSGPDWIENDRYNISGKAAGPASEDELRLMLQALLAERFHLAFHRQTKELHAYEMVIAKGGAKFHESQVEGEPIVNPDKSRMTVDVKGMPASQIVDVLSRMLHSPVINNTGFTGRYDATVNIARYMPDGTTPFEPIATIILAMQEELGLKLESKKMAIDLLIVDHAEKIPAEN